MVICRVGLVGLGWVGGSSLLRLSMKSVFSLSRSENGNRWCWALSQPPNILTTHLSTLSSNMGSSNTKVKCLVRPGQSGKTRTMQELIFEYADRAKISHGEGSTPLNIVICSNNRSLVHQTTVRMDNDLYDGGESVTSEDSESGPANAVVDGSCFSWVSGTRGVVTPKELAWDVLSGKITMIVCCANKKRIDYVYELISHLDKTSAYRNKINVWIDEADESINMWSRPSVDATRMDVVSEVTLVSATFNSILAMYERIHVLAYADTHPECYHKVTDCEQVKNDAAGNAADYLAAVLPTLNPKSGMRLFAPGDMKVSSHGDVASFLVERGFAVLVLNGAEKQIRMPNGSFIKIDQTTHEEIGRQVARLYRENNLDRMPFAVTGHQCIGRGLTFQNQDFLFTAGVIPTISGAAMAYQTACRMAGNIRGLPGYKQVPLVMTTKMWDTITSQENTAVNLARIVHERGLADVGIEEFVEAGYDVNAAPPTPMFVGDKKGGGLGAKLNENASIEKFKTMEELLDRWNEIVKTQAAKGVKSSGKPRIPRKCATTGKYKCSIGGESGVQSAYDIEKFATGTKSWGAGLSGAKPGQLIQRVYAGYKGDAPVFFLRWTYAMPAPGGVRGLFAPRRV